MAELRRGGIVVLRDEHGAGGLVIAAYAGSLLCLLRQRRSPLNASATGEAAGRGHLPSPPAP